MAETSTPRITPQRAAQHTACQVVVISESLVIGYLLPRQSTNTGNKAEQNSNPTMIFSRMSAARISLSYSELCERCTVKTFRIKFYGRAKTIASKSHLYLDARGRPPSLPFSRTARCFAGDLLAPPSLPRIEAAERVSE